NNITGTLNLLGGTLTITTTGSAIAGGSGTSVVNLANTTLKAGASSTAWITGLTTANIAGSGVTFDTAGYDITIPQSFSGTGAVTKVGAGMLLLSGASSYSGGTLLSVGTLVANASTALGSGLLTMNGGVLSN
ncbi:MAG: autotransporter-associated beta strand repeat-containing protein, partial [Kiritimatiellaeota bacterium]|nr:autotransporter-associated beta strand repeat-containing protein [Kiritimatiellota bacterium]